ncbi:MAG: hypothetical protein ACK47B_22170 [Armatimonadota bacterium]
MDATIERETLRDGSVRLREGDCSLVFTRLRPGVVLLTVYGHDTGRFGSAPFAELQGAVDRFRAPIELFVDTRQATRVDPKVSDAWTAWFVENRGSLKRVSLLVGSKGLELTVSLVKHFSHTGGLMTIYTDLEQFEEAIGRAVPGFVKLPSQRVAEEEPSRCRREVLEDGSVRIAGPSCSFHFRELGPSAVGVSISGHDTGELGPIPLDELQARVAECRQPAELFIDTTEAVSAAASVSEDWTAWFLARRDSLRRVHVLTGSRLLHLSLCIASELSGTGGLLVLHTEADRFRAAQERAISGTAGRFPG